MPQQKLINQSEHRYRELLEQAAEGVCLTDERLRLLLVNQAFCDMFGYTREEFLTMTMADLVLAQDQERLAAQLADVFQGQTVYSEQRLRRRDGSTILVEGSGKLMRDGTIQIVLRDISERKKAEEKLRQTEAFYRAITEKNNEGVMVLDKNFVVLYRKPPRAEVSHYSNEELVGQNRSDLIHPDDMKQFARGLAKLKSEQTLTFVFRVKNLSGGWDYFESVTTNLLDNPQVEGYVVNYRNINERKKAEETLKQTEAFYRAITEKSYEGITVIDKSGKVRYRSKVNAEATGYQDEELTAENFARFTHPDDQERVRNTIQQLVPGESRLVESRLRTAGGEWRWLENRITNLLDQAAVQGYVINTRDINERKKSEEKLQETEAFYRAITEQSNEGVMVFDEGMTIVYRNPSQLHQMFFPYEEMVGHNRTDLIHPDDLEAFRLELPHLRPGQTLLNTFRLKTQDGRWEWFESRVTNLLDHPAVRGYVSNYSNINERKEAEARQRELSQRLLEVQEEERRRLARELHDEIGQSLTAVKVSLQSAQRFGNAEAVSNALGVTEQLLTQVRELSLSLHPALLEDLGLVAAVRWYTLQQSERSGLKIKLELDLDEAGLSPELKLTLYRVVQEGLTNIVRHSQAKEVTVSLLAQNTTVVLRVKDDGVGFEANDSTKASLGLLGMKERVSLQGGRFQIKSSLDSGTELYASFPLGV